MKKYDITVNIDDNQKVLDLVDKTLAGVFNGEPDTSVQIIRVLLRVLSTYEMPGPYKVIWAILESLHTKQNKIIAGDTFSRDLYVTIVEQGINTIVRKYRYSFEAWIKKRGLEYNLKVVRDFKAFCDFLLHAAILKYDEILQENPALALGYLDPLCNELKRCALEKGLTDVTTVLTIGMDDKRAGMLHGPEDTLNMLQLITTRIAEKYEANNVVEQRYTQFTLNDAEDAKEFLKSTEVVLPGRRKMFSPLFDLNWGPLDLVLCVGDILCIIGNEGVGKTKLLVDKAYSAIQSGLNTLIICTETKASIILHMLYARHIFEKMQMRISESELITFSGMIEGLDENEVRKEQEEVYTQFVELEHDFHNNPAYGKLTLLQSSTYKDLERQVSEYSKNGQGALVCIDSISFLDGKSDEKSDVDLLMGTLTKATEMYGLTFIITTHTSSDANKELHKNKQTGVRVGAGSSYVTKMSTLSILVDQPEEMQAQELFVFEAKKTRYRKRTNPKVIMSRVGESNYYYYDKRLQVSTDVVDSLSESEFFE